VRCRGRCRDRSVCLCIAGAGAWRRLSVCALPGQVQGEGGPQLARLNLDLGGEPLLHGFEVFLAGLEALRGRLGAALLKPAL
jgi:hypothetical protein